MKTLSLLLKLGAFAIATLLSFPAQTSIIHVQGEVVIENPSVGRVFLSRPAAQTPQPESVDYSTSDRSANAELDYTPQSGTITFQPGETEKEIRILLLANAVHGIWDPPKSFAVTFTNASTGTTLDQTQALVT